MSRVAKQPVEIPAGVEVNVANGLIAVKGPKGRLEQPLHTLVRVAKDGSAMRVERVNDTKFSRAMSGTTRALLANMVTGVTKGFEKKLSIIGVGYRAAVQGKSLNLTLGFSHPVVYPIPDGITIEAPTQTELLVKGASRQQVGQVASEIRGFRPPEPYKGKGVRYSNEAVVKKEAKKK